MNSIELKAKELSKDFLENEKQYRLGFVESEQSNALTKTLGETFVRDTLKGVEMLISADKVLCGLFEKTLFSKEFDEFFEDVLCCLKNNGRVVISGCGSSGRLAMRIEASFRIAIDELSKKYPEARKYKDSVISLMTGGDYAIIRAVESFEDYISLGKMQAKELEMSENDILVGVTATAETTSVVGTALQALEDGAGVWMVVCTKPESLFGKLERADALYSNKKCKSLYMNCGGMAVTGSTRMQSSTIEQAAISACLEMALCTLFEGNKDKKYIADGFEKCVQALCEENNLKSMTALVDNEAQLYENGGHVTYFADEYLLDVLADTTERGPTFSTPAFRPQERTDLPLSPAFVKNPFYDTKEAWTACFERLPRCIDKTAQDYKKIGIRDEDVSKIPNITLEALYKYKIGNESDKEREKGNSLAVWISDSASVPKQFLDAASDYKNQTTLVLDIPNEKIHKTHLKMFNHLAMKMMMNNVSTGTMAKVGRIKGNYMVYINISNKKLVDRATRIVSELCSLDYDEANYQLFLTKLMLEQKQIEGSVAIETIKRLNK